MSLAGLYKVPTSSRQKYLLYSSGFLNNPKSNPASHLPKTRRNLWKGKEKANYGDALLKQLSIELTKDLGKGFSYANLENFRQYYLT